MDECKPLIAGGTWRMTGAAGAKVGVWVEVGAGAGAGFRAEGGGGQLRVILVVAVCAATPIAAMAEV